MFAGIDFPNRFDKDNFTSRRATGHNMFDPESLISGAEIAQGMTYKNSKRYWASERLYKKATEGFFSVESILYAAPRKLLTERNYCV